MASDVPVQDRRKGPTHAELSLSVVVLGGLAAIAFLLILGGAHPASAATTTSSTSVTCSPSPVAFGSPSKCTAKVSGTSPTGSIGWSTSGTGGFSSQTCTLSSASCSVQYTPSSSSSPVTITASYGGNSKNSASMGVFSLSVELASTTTSAACSPSSTEVGSFTVCTSKVVGVNETGTVTWTSTGNGTFQATSCLLKSGECSVVYTPYSPQSTTLKATYGGDVNNENSSYSFSLPVTKTSTTVTLSCSPATIFEGETSSCTATVVGYDPGGNVTFTSSQDVGSFAPADALCLVSSGSCAIGFTGTTGGTTKVTASYGGDSNNLASKSGSFSITVIHETGYVLSPTESSSSSDCDTLGGSWYSNATCSLNGDVALSDDDYISVMPGAALAIGTSATVTDSATINDSGGVISNYGVINMLAGAALYISPDGADCGSATNAGSVTNLGTIVNECSFINIDTVSDLDGAFIYARGGSFVNEGTVDIVAGAGLVVGSGNAGTFSNSGTVEVSGTLDLYGGDVISVTGSFGSSGSFNNTGSVIINSGSTLVVGEGGVGSVLDVTSGTLSIPSGVTLLVGDSGELMVGAGAALRNYGQITLQAADAYGHPGGAVASSGIIYNEAGGTMADNSGAEVVVNQGGELSNSGTLTVDGLLSNTGTMINGGTLTDEGTVSNHGSVVNYGAITVTDYATVVNNAGGTLTNSGTITISSGVLINNSGGVIVEDSGGTIDNVAGTIDNNSGGSISNRAGGVIDDKSAAYMDNNKGGNLTNSGEIESQGTFTTNGNVTNLGSVTSSGTITNSGLIQNNGSLTTSGVVTSTGTISNAGALDNSGTLTTSGSLVDESEGALTNSGTITSSGQITNDGAMIDASGGGINNRGQFTNSGYLYACNSEDVSWTGSGVQVACTEAQAAQAVVASSSVPVQALTSVDVSVSLSGTTGETVLISAAQEPSQPAGTPTVPLNDIGGTPLKFYDLSVFGASGGTAYVCVSLAAVDSLTTIEYYSSGAWAMASGVVASPGDKVCGNILVDDLGGTPLVLGDAASMTTSYTSSSTSSTSTHRTTTHVQTTTSVQTTSSTMSSSSASNSTVSSSQSTTNSSTLVLTTATSKGIPEFPSEATAEALFSIAAVVVGYVLVRSKRERSDA